MFSCYLYTTNREVEKYILNALQNYNVVVVDDVAELFDIKEENSILIFHINSQEENVMELVGDILKDLDSLKILTLSDRINFIEGTKLLQIGVKGYGNTYMHNVLLNQAIDLIVSGNVWMYPELANHLIKNMARETVLSDNEKLESLSEKEKECAVLASEGNSNKDIAELLNLQEVSIKKYLSSVYKKLTIKNRIELALYLKE